MAWRSTLITLIATAMLAIAAVPATAGGLPTGACTGDPTQPQSFSIDVGGQPSRGAYALPSRSPRALVVFAHGYSHRVEGWLRRLSLVARDDGAATMVMNYRGLIDLPPDAAGVPRSRGYPVEAGSEDLNAGTLAMLAACPSIRTVVLMGVSMGGNASGMALALNPRRADGSPLYDYWVDVEAVSNLLQLYEGARVAEQISEFAANAKADIETETGGIPETHASAYLHRTVVGRVPEIARTGLKGAWLVHGVEDGLALYDNSVQLANLLRGVGIPADLVTVTRRGADDDPDTTLAGYAGLATGLAGHGGEISERHAVIDTGMARLHALLTSAEPRPCNRDFVYDGLPRTISPDPAAATSSCPAAEPLAGPGAPPATSTAPCRDREAPRLSGVRAVRVTGGRLRVTGRVTDRACGLPSVAVPRVRIAISRRRGRGTCQVVGTSGRLGRVRRCARRPTLGARGDASFVLRTGRRLPGGHYAIRVTARDAAGNARARRLDLRLR